MFRLDSLIGNIINGHMFTCKWEEHLHSNEIYIAVRYSL